MFVSLRPSWKTARIGYIGIALALISTPVIGGDLDFATAQLHDSEGDLVGEATLKDWPGGVMIELQLAGLTPGEHAVHLHETGSCMPDFSAAGGHFAPSGNEHGFASENGPHAGDLPNVFVGVDGDAAVHIVNTRITLADRANSLLDDDGAALIVHAAADTYDETADAGGRVACGVIKRGL